MNTNYFSVFKSVLKNNIFLFFVMVLLSSFVFISCSSDDDDMIKGSSFEIMGNPTVLSVKSTESTTSFDVLSNRPWKVVAVETDGWAKASPSEGENNGSFKIIVQENKTFEKRTMNFVFVVDGKEEAKKLRVEQEGLKSFLNY